MDRPSFDQFGQNLKIGKISDLEYGTGVDMKGWRHCIWRGFVLLVGPVVQADQEYVMPDPNAVYHSNLGKQNIVKVNRQKDFDFVGQTPDEIAPGSIPLGSLRDWAKKNRGEKDKPSKGSFSSAADLNAIVANRKIEGWVGSLPPRLPPDPSLWAKCVEESSGGTL